MADGHAISAAPGTSQIRRACDVSIAGGAVANVTRAVASLHGCHGYAVARPAALNRENRPGISLGADLFEKDVLLNLSLLFSPFYLKVFAYWLTVCLMIISGPV